MNNTSWSMLEGTRKVEHQVWTTSPHRGRILFLNYAKLSLPTSHVRVYSENVVCPLVVVHGCIHPQCPTCIHSKENATVRATTYNVVQARLGADLKAVKTSICGSTGAEHSRQQSGLPGCQADLVHFPVPSRISVPSTVAYRYEQRRADREANNLRQDTIRRKFKCARDRLYRSKPVRCHASHAISVLRELHKPLGEMRLASHGAKVIGSIRS